jgi:hypothetical protein
MVLAVLKSTPVNPVLRGSTKGDKTSEKTLLTTKKTKESSAAAVPDMGFVLQFISKIGIRHCQFAVVLLLDAGALAIILAPLHESCHVNSILSGRDVRGHKLLCPHRK